MSAMCHTCKRVLPAGEPAWASDWTILPDGEPRTEVRYSCDDCAGAA